jgi:hypothetical protein
MTNLVLVDLLLYSSQYWTLYSELDFCLFWVKEEKILAHLAHKLDYGQHYQGLAVSVTSRAAIFPFLTVSGPDLGSKHAPI